MARSSTSRTASTRTPAAPATSRPWIIGGIALVVLAGGIVAWMLGRRDLAAEVIARQRELVSSAGRLRSADVDAFIRQADRLSRTEARAVRADLATEWQRLKQESVDRYFAAAEADRPALLDDDIARLQKFHRLMASLNPMDMPGGPVWAPRAPRPPRDAARPPEVVEAEKARRELVEMYDAARAARAKAQGISLPEFR